jgi:tetratricopeptide (TPR) repeat protein
MGMFDWLAGRRPPEPPPDLREALIAAYSAQQYEALADLINANVSAIREAFPGWTTLPSGIRHDPKALDRYGRTLFAIATAFEQAGDATLMTQLRGGRQMIEWGNDLDAARKLLDEERAAEAVPLLRTLLASFDGLSGNGVAYYRPRVLGSLGVALAQTGDKREAVKVTREALELCRAAGDEEGIRTYTTNLDALGTFDMPAHDGTDANMTVVYRDEQGHTLTLDELQTAGGKVKWEVRGAASVPPEAERLHREGRAAGARGDYETAASLLTRAAELAPSWPHPYYDRAFTHLLQDDFAAALRDYRKTMELAPGGFFTAEVAVDTLTREATGEFFSGLYAAFAMLEHMPVDQRRAIVAQLVEKLPSFAPAWSEHADSVTDPVQRLEAIEKGLAARPDRDTRGFLIIKKAMTTSALGDTDGAARLLHQLASDSTAPANTRAAAEFALAKLLPNAQP